MSESVQFSLDLPVSPERVYRAWFDGYETSQFTGSPAQIDARAGGDFSLRDGAMRGRTLVMTPFSHIVQTFRSVNFPAGSRDAHMDITLEPTCLGALLTLTYTGLPEGQAAATLNEWVEGYFRPMAAYFEALVGGRAVDIDG